MFDVGVIKNPNQIIGISCSSASILLSLVFNTRGADRDGLMILLLFLSVGLLIGYLFWGSLKNEDWQWGYMSVSIVILAFIFLRLKSNYGIRCSSGNYQKLE